MGQLAGPTQLHPFGIDLAHESLVLGLWPPRLLLWLAVSHREHGGVAAATSSNGHAFDPPVSITTTIVVVVLPV